MHTRIPDRARTFTIVGTLPAWISHASASSLAVRRSPMGARPGAGAAGCCTCLAWSGTSARQRTPAPGGRAAGSLALPDRVPIDETRTSAGERSRSHRSGPRAPRSDAGQLAKLVANSPADESQDRLMLLGVSLHQLHQERPEREAPHQTKSPRHALQLARVLALGLEEA